MFADAWVSQRLVLLPGKVPGFLVLGLRLKLNEIGVNMSKSQVETASMPVYIAQGIKETRRYRALEQAPLYGFRNSRRLGGSVFVW